jgi:hypothetical protein
MPTAYPCGATNEVSAHPFLGREIVRSARGEAEPDVHVAHGYREPCAQAFDVRLLSSPAPEHGLLTLPGREGHECGQFGRVQSLEKSLGLHPLCRLDVDAHWGAAQSYQRNVPYIGQGEVKSL